MMTRDPLLPGPARTRTSARNPARSPARGPHRCPPLGSGLAPVLEAACSGSLTARLATRRPGRPPWARISLRAAGHPRHPEGGLGRGAGPARSLVRRGPGHSHGPERVSAGRSQPRSMPGRRGRRPAAFWRAGRTGEGRVAASSRTAAVRALRAPPHGAVQGPDGLPPRCWPPRWRESRWSCGRTTSVRPPPPCRAAWPCAAPEIRAAAAPAGHNASHHRRAGGSGPRASRRPAAATRHREGTPWPSS